MLFFIGGYLFYSAIYAAIGSAVDNVQDASQLSTIAISSIRPMKYDSVADDAVSSSLSMRMVG